MRTILESPHITMLKIFTPNMISLGISLSDIEAALRIASLGVSMGLSVAAYLRARKKRKDESETN